MSAPRTFPVSLRIHLDGRATNLTAGRARCRRPDKLSQLIMHSRRSVRLARSVEPRDTRSIPPDYRGHAAVFAPRSSLRPRPRPRPFRLFSFLSPSSLPFISPFYGAINCEQTSRTALTYDAGFRFAARFWA